MKKLILGLTLLIASTANADIIIYNEITSTRLDTEFQISGENTHVDIEANLEWLDFGTHDGFDVTFGQSINDTVAFYAEYGFKLATESQVADLFSFFYTDFVDSGDGTMTVIEDPDLTIMQERNSWLVGFGTHEQTTGSELGDTLYSWGMYEADDGSVQYAGFDMFLDSADNVNTTFTSTAYTIDALSRDSAYANLGVFMVRDYTVVPIPAAVWLFGSGLLGLVAVARRKHK